MNIFKRFWKSLYSPPDIAQFRKGKISQGIIYILVLSFIAFLPLAYFTTISSNDALKVGKETIQTEIPDFTVKDGKLEATNKKEDLPVTIDEGSLHLFFDPSGTLDADDVDNKIGPYDGAVALLSDSIYITAGGYSQTVSYQTAGISSKADLVSTYQTIEDLSRYFIPLILLLLFLFTLVGAFFRIAIYGLFGYILTGFGRGGVSYKENWMMAAYSITLAVTFTMVMEWLQVAVPFGMEINMVVSMIVLFLAIRTIQPPKQAGS